MSCEEVFLKQLRQRGYRLRSRFAPEQRVDERFVRAFALAAGG